MLGLLGIQSIRDLVLEVPKLGSDQADYFGTAIDVAFTAFVATQLANLIGFAWAQMLAAWCESPATAMALWQPGVYVWAQTSGYPIQASAMAPLNPAKIVMCALVSLPGLSRATRESPRG